MKVKVLQSKQSFRVREVVDATIADRDEGHKPEDTGLQNQRVTDKYGSDKRSEVG